jgi:hypothetical protein
MSGGSYDYAYQRVRDVADEIEERHPEEAKHLAFAAHLRLVATAMRAIEWVDSCDYGPGDDHEAIDAVLVRSK